MIIEFFLEHYSLLTHLLEFLAAFTGLLLIKKYNSKAAKYFIYFLVVIATSDSLCYYTHYVRPGMALEFLIGTKFAKNHWWSTLYWDVGTILFFTYFFYLILKTPVFKKVVKFLGYFYFVFSTIYILSNWEKFFVQFFEILDVFGAIIIFMCTVFYFIEILLSEEILEFYRSIYFYISAVIFIWWLIITPLGFYDIYFTYEVGKNFFDKAFVDLRRQIYLFVNIFMYLTYTFALIWCKPENE